MRPLMTWKTKLTLLVALVTLSTLTGCSGSGSVRYVTGKDYLILKKGDAYLALRDETWASQYVIQTKDEQLMDLLRSNEKLIREVNMLRTTH